MGYDILTIATWNVNHLSTTMSANNQEKYSDKLSAVAHVLQQTKCDILTLQEINEVQLSELDSLKTYAVGEYIIDLGPKLKKDGYEEYYPAIYRQDRLKLVDTFAVEPRRHNSSGVEYVSVPLGQGVRGWTLITWSLDAGIPA